MELQDRTIKCATCGREFLYTVKEQAFFASKGFKEPKHCRECRQQRKQSQMQAMNQAAGGQAQQHRGKEMFKVICGNCQRETYVPFKPTTGKPVLCKDCFIAQRYGTGQQPAGGVKPASSGSGSEAQEAVPQPESSPEDRKTANPGPRESEDNLNPEPLKPPISEPNPATVSDYPLAAKEPEA